MGNLKVYGNLTNSKTMRRTWLDTSPCNTHEYEDAVFYPAKFTKSGSVWYNRGGICDREGTFVGGLCRAEEQPIENLYFSLGNPLQSEII